MGLLKFELKKVFRQKKLLWLLVIAILATSGIYYKNISQHTNIIEDEKDRVKGYIEEIGIVQDLLINIEENTGLNDMQQKQYDHLQQMLLSSVQWRSSIESRQFDDALSNEKQFLAELQLYKEQGGQPLSTLAGLEKHITIEKNAWLIDHGLYYEDESIPQSIHLLTKETSTFLLGLVGMLTLLLFFGSTLTEEKEENTWRTLKTQPITNWKLIISKYISLILVSAVFIVIVLGVGITLPSILGDHPMGFQYPQVLTQEDSFTTISTFEHLLRLSTLFLGASIFVFSVALFLNRWSENSFSVLMMTVFSVFTGYFITHLFSPLQTVFNPFYHLNFSVILSQLPQSTDWLYPAMSLIWSIIILAFTILIPEREINLIYTSQYKKPFKNGQTSKKQSLWNINTFEWRKLIRKGLVIKVYILLAFMVFFGHTIVTQQTQKKEADYIENLESYIYHRENSLIPSAEEMIERYKEELKEEPDNIWAQKNLEEQKKRLAFRNRELEKLNAAVKGYKKGDWQALYEYQLFRNRADNEEFEGYRRGGDDYVGQFARAVSIEEKKWLMKNDIQPVCSGIYIPTTMYSNWVSDEGEERWVERNTKIDNSGLFSLYLYFERYIYFVPLGIFLFLLGGGLAAEQGKKNTLNLLKTQPIAENKLFLGKLFNAKIVAVASCIAIFLLVILVGTVFERFGDWQYPILNYDSIAEVEASDYDGHKVDIEDFTVGFHFMNLGRFLIESIVLFSFVALFFISLSIFISLFLKREMSVLATTALIGAAGFALSQELTEMAHLSPFTYLNIPKIINGEIATTLNNPSVNLQTGIAVLLTVTAVLVLAGYFISGRKNAVTNKNQATEELNNKL
ncbi:ABC transporter permease subunit [Proteinivorax tanatarense]|uniref:ABC transporter permease subunit n=1 Tax=Proteinivorax tanatarense TaxID=1260629 RepID=A0AAU7VKV1_9FIRM